MATELSKDELRELKAMSRPSDQHGLVHLAGHLAAILASGVLIWGCRDIWWALAPAMVLHGVLLIFLFCPLHESIHATAFRSRRLNTAVGWLTGFVLLLPPAYFRAFHLAHHRYTQDPDRDPELVQGKPATLGGYLWHISGIPYWRDQVRLLLVHASGRAEADFIPKRERPAAVLEARAYLAGYAVIAAAAITLSSWAPVIYWLAPVALGQPFLRLYLLAEHTGCPEIPDMFRNTRTTLTNPLVRALAWNMPYHTEHHVFPALPFHALPRAHTLLRPRLGVMESGYLRVEADIARAMLHAERPGARTAG